MRISAIRGKDLASLKGEFSIELDQPPLSSLGLFSIHGPVGAGKSTLLDAMTLALFGRTPRLTNSGGAPVLHSDDDDPKHALKSNDPKTLVRKQASHAYAEVDFVGVDGHAYRARWEIKRGRTGRLQEPAHALVELQGGSRLGDGKRDVRLAIEERLGLSFDELCRSVLLAQGGFQSFLTAPADERAALLERMTGTEIYSRLSVAAHERKAAMQRQLDELRAQMARHEVLSDDARTALETALVQEKTAVVEAEAAIVSVRGIMERRAARRAVAAAAVEVDAAVTSADSARAALAALGDDAVDVVTARSRLASVTRVMSLVEQRDGARAIREAAAARTAATAQALQSAREAQASLRIDVDVDRYDDDVHAARARAGAAARHELTMHTAACVAQASVVARVEAAHTKSMAMRALQQAKEALKDGEPCPVCGSTEHPGHDGKDVAAMALDDVLKAERAALERAQSEAERVRAIAVMFAPYAKADVSSSISTAHALAELQALEERASDIAIARAARRAVELASDAHDDAMRAVAVHDTSLASIVASLLDAACAAADVGLVVDVDSAMLAAELRALRVKVQTEEQETARRARAFEEARARVRDAGERIASARAIYADRADRLAALGEVDDDDSIDDDALRLRLRQAEQRAEEGRVSSVRHQVSLERDAAALSARAALSQELAALEASSQVWFALASVIGSADGKRFRQFAQGLTLDALVAHANVQLALFAPRYQLRRTGAPSERHDLDLVIVDADAGMEVRSTKTLSGGETFLVSLALALGLSALSANEGVRGRVDSLFIDEGFSALDQDTLDVALSAFDVLRQTGRQIGLISHVPLLVERLGAQVRVIPQGGGTSRVEVHAL